MATSPYVDYTKKREKLLEEFRNHLNSTSFSDRSVALKKSSSNLFRNRKEKESKKLDVRALNRVIKIDPVSLTADVEAMTTFEDLVKETLKYDLLPAVVPELKTITVGGALVGLGIESSSFRHGLVHETILEVEVLAGDGNLYTCRPDNAHRDLFFALPNSYGTLGYVLKATVKLIPAKKYVKMSNLRFQDARSFFNALKELIHEKREQKEECFIDGVIFSKEEMFIILGEFVDVAPKLSDYTYMSPYFRAIQKKEVHYLTTHDYIWRWDADWFWCSKHFGMHHAWLRLLLGKILLHSRVYWKIKHLIATHAPLKRILSLFEIPSESVIQDILIPIENAPAFYQFFQEKIGITPIWICPFQFCQKKYTYTLCKLDPETLYIDFGFWDLVPTHPGDSKPDGALNRAIEKKTLELSGFKSLYSDSYYTQEEFWKIYPKERFSQLKSRYDPRQAFKDLYQKCVNKNVKT